MGITGGVIVYYAVHLKHVLKVDDSLDAFGAHGIGGVIGNILTGVFAQKWVATLDGAVINGGWIEGNWIQMGYQLGGTAVIAAYSFGVSFLILYVLNKIPGLHLRASDDHEEMGVDLAELGQMAYETMHDDAIAAEKQKLQTIARIDSSSSSSKTQPGEELDA